jgi:hypothetical protein
MVQRILNEMRPATAATLIVLCASAASAQPAADEQTLPNFRVHVVGHIGTDFEARMARYLELRRTLEVGLPPLTLTDAPADIGRAERALAKRIRMARGSKQGDLFTPLIAVEFRRVLRLETDISTLKSIQDENPGFFEHRINGTYPKEHSLSTVPANVLALLPSLPGDIQYRFLGRHLILHDTRANVILDRITCALRCSGR